MYAPGPGPSGLAEPRPARGEAPLDPREMFFSRTDAAGRILAGNHVFRRVADYSWSQMLGAPHSLVRHPDMPAGMFHLFWKRLRAGQPVGLYVKNLARDGLHYWVFNVTLPCDGGFVSARVKATAPLRGTVEALYAEARAAERGQGLSPEDSSGFLQQRLRALGHAGYSRFAAHALAEELLSRDRALQRPADPAILRHRAMLGAAAALAEETGGLSRAFRRNGVIPHNMRLTAARLEPAGGPLSTLATNYGAMWREMSLWYDTHLADPESNFATIEAAVSDSMFRGAMAFILAGCARQLAAEQGLPGTLHGPLDAAAERARLERLAAEWRGRARDSQARVGAQVGRILAACRRMKRHVMGLSSTRVMCRIEGARQAVAGGGDGEDGSGGAGAGLAEIIDQLGGFEQQVRARLERIEGRGAEIRAGLR